MFRHEEALEAVELMLDELVDSGEISAEGIGTEDRLRALVSERDSAVCQKLNERYSEILELSRYTGSENGNVYPAFQPVYLRYSDFLVAYFMPYYPEPEDGEPPMVGGGLSLLYIFDENMNLLHHSSR